MTLTVRSATVSGATTKNSPLTHAEFDANWAHVIDSANHSFTAAGAGAVSLTVQDEIRAMSARPEQFDCVGDGTTDDSTNFQKAITAAIANGQPLYIPHGKTYMCAGLTISSSLYVWGGGTIKRTASTTGAILTVSATTGGVLIEGITIDGNKDNQAAVDASTPAGVSLSAAAHVTFKSVRFPNHQRRNLYALNSSYVTVDGCYFNYGDGASGVSSSQLVFDTTTGTDQITVVNNTFDKVQTLPYFGLVAFRGSLANNGSCTNVVFANNRVTQPLEVSHVNAGGVEFGLGCARFSCTGNVFEGGFIPISVSQSDKGTVSGNYVICGHANTAALGNGHDGIEVTSSNEVAVSGNSVNGSAVLLIGIGVISATNVSVSGNTVRNLNTSNVTQGVRVKESDIVSVSGNSISGPTYYGVFCENTASHEDVAITGNVISGTCTVGVYISNYSNYVITGNSMNITGDYGISINASSGTPDYITVADNTIQGASGNPRILSAGSNWGTTSVYVEQFIANPAIAGAWMVGATVINPAPAIGRATMWRCITAGSPGTWVPVASLPSKNTTAVGNITTGEDNLQSLTISASTLRAAGYGIRITAWGTAANNANAKTLKLYFGATAISTQTLTTSQASEWEFSAIVISTGTDAQNYKVRFFQDGATEIHDFVNGSTIEDDGATITVKCTGEGTATNDVVQEGMLVEFF